jgi:hypothetical protein
LCGILFAIAYAGLFAAFGALTPHEHALISRYVRRAKNLGRRDTRVEEPVTGK